MIDNPCYLRFYTHNSEAIHFNFAVIMCSYPSGPPNVYWTNTYFFSGGFAVKVSL